MITQADFQSLVYRCWRHFCVVEPFPFVLTDFSQRQGLLTLGVLVEFRAAKQAIVILVDEQVGTKLASVMFACQPEQLSQGQVMDALGEMANIIAGHVKTEQALNDSISTPVALPPEWLQQIKSAVGLSLPCALQLDSSLLYVLLFEHKIPFHSAFPIGA